MIRDSLETKPQALTFLPLGLGAEAMQLWQGCVLAMPFWSIGERHVEDVGPFKFHGVMGSGISPSADWRGSPFGASLFWNGNTNDKLTVADPPINRLDGFSAFSVEIIFKSASIGADGTFYGLVGKHRPSSGARAWRLYIDGDELQLQTSNDGEGNEVQQTTNANLAANTWHQAIVTFRLGVWAVRLNGRLLTTDGNFSTHTTIFGGTEELKIGQRTTAGGGSDNPLSGEIASVRIWDRALLVEETLRLWERKWEMYDRGEPGFGYADMLASGAAAGPWTLAGSVAAGVEAFLITGLENGVSYDVRARPKDQTGNQAAGNAPVTATPVAGQDVPPGVRVRIHAPSMARPEVPWIALS